VCGERVPINPERLNKLKDLGLAEYQARVYLALLDLGSATASQIPTLSRVPRTRIYVTMAQLHEKGLVNIIPERPLRYEPIPISDYLMRKVVGHRESAEMLEDTIELLSEEFTVKGDVEPEQKSHFEAIYGRRNYRDKLKEMVSVAKEEIIFVGTPKSPLRLVGALLQELEEKAKENLNIRFIFTIDSENKSKFEDVSKYAQFRHIDFDPLIDWAIIDSRELLVSHSIPNDENPIKGDDVSIWTDDVAIVNSRKKLAQDIWENGIDPIKFDPDEVMLNTAMQWMKLKNLKLNRRAIAESIGNSVGVQIAKRLGSNTKDDLIKELSDFWKNSQLGVLSLSKEEPITLTLVHTIDCQYKLDVGKPVCPFTEHVFKTIFDEKLGTDSSVKVTKCTASGDGNCELQIVLN
jgi:sugar-specific transcriptional regulator TrmB